MVVQQPKFTRVEEPTLLCNQVDFGCAPSGGSFLKSYRGHAGTANERRELVRSSIKPCQLLQPPQTEFHDPVRPLENREKPRLRSSHGDPRSRFGFSGWAVPDHQRMSRARHFKIQVPAKILLTGFFISCQVLFP